LLQNELYIGTTTGVLYICANKITKVILIYWERSC